MKKLKYIVTGTGRSGTVYMARFLTSVGVVCGHECVFNRFGVEYAEDRLNHPEKIRTSLVSGDSWLTDGEVVVADSSYMAAPYLSHPILGGTELIHAVRHPLRVISSFVKDLGYFWGTEVKSSYETFIYGAIPQLYQPLTPLERACIFYVKWNEMIEKSPLKYFRFRVEDRPDELVNFLEAHSYSPATAFHDRKANTMQTGKKPVTLKDIRPGEAKDAFVAMGERYGYDMNLRVKLF